MKKRRILVIEDGMIIQALFKDCLSEYGEIIQAFTLQEAETKFSTEKDLTHILVDGSLGSHREDGKPSTTELVIRMRREFTGPIIAISCSDEYNAFLKSLGCDQAIYKGDAPKKIEKLFEEEEIKS